MQIEPPQKIDCEHMVTTKEGEKVIMNQLRSIREFNRSMKDLIVRLFYTVDSQTPNTNNRSLGSDSNALDSCGPSGA